MAIDRWQALYDFWSGFGWAAYEENSVPKDAEYPYITYEANTAGFENIVSLTASLWTRNGSWEEADRKSDEIENYIKTMGCPRIKDGRYRVFTEGEFAQSMGDPDDILIKRKLLNIQVEFMTL